MRLSERSPSASEIEREPMQGAPGIHYKNRHQESCFMPLSHIYRDTQVVSNWNILAGVPLTRFESQSPLQLVYDPLESDASDSFD
jgi:hypothetical protein